MTGLKDHCDSNYSSYHGRWKHCGTVGINVTDLNLIFLHEITAIVWIVWPQQSLGSYMHEYWACAPGDVLKDFASTNHTTKQGNCF